ARRSGSRERSARAAGRSLSSSEALLPNTNGGARASVAVRVSGLHPVSPLRLGGLGRREKGEQLARRVGTSAMRADAARENRHALDLRGHEPEHVDTVVTDQLAELLKSDLGLAFGDERRDRHAGRRHDDALANRLENAPALE